VLDLLGFGGSSCPTNVESYTYRALVSYLCEVLDHFACARAVFLGHDWGGSVVWQMAWQQPSRVLGLVAFCTPLRPPTKQYTSPQKVADKMPFFQYQVYFDRADGVAEAELDRDPSVSVALMLRTPHASDPYRRAISHGLRNAGKSGHGLACPGLFDRLPSPLDPATVRAHQAVSEEERAAYAAAFQRTGFGPGLNLYRTSFLNWQDAMTLLAARGGRFVVDVPALIVTAGLDKILSPELTYVFV